MVDMETGFFHIGIVVKKLPNKIFHFEGMLTIKNRIPQPDMQLKG